MGNGVGLYGIKNIKWPARWKTTRPSSAFESPGHIPGRATAKVPAGVALFIKLRERTFGEAAGHAEQRRDPHPENGAGPPAAMASATPAILPLPTRAARLAQSA
jgi:hypothetical protein